VGLTFKKYGLYKYLEENKIDYTDFISKKILPDDAVLVIANNTMHIIEVKFQEVAGSTDEKLQTCDFKIKQYRKLFSRLNIEVKYIYVLNGKKILIVDSYPAEQMKLVGQIDFNESVNIRNMFIISAYHTSTYDR